MTIEHEAAGTSKGMYWAGWILTGLLTALLVTSGVMKIMQPAEVMEEFTRLGWPEKVAVGLGLVEIVCAALYANPRTAVLGAILLTGYFGGAIATHIRIGEQFAGPAIIGVLVWLGIYLRDARLRALLPIRR